MSDAAIGLAKSEFDVESSVEGANTANMLFSFGALCLERYTMIMSLCGYYTILHEVHACFDSATCSF